MGLFEQAVLTETIKALRIKDRLWRPRTGGTGNGREAVPLRWWTEDQSLCIVYEQPPFAGLRGVRWVLDPDSDRDMDSLYAGREVTLSAAPEWAGMFVEGELTDDLPTPGTSSDVDHGFISWSRDVCEGLANSLAPGDSDEFEATVLREVVRQLRRAGRVWGGLDDFRAYRTDGRAIVPVSWWVEQDAVCLVYEQPPVAGLHGVWYSVRHLPDSALRQPTAPSRTPDPAELASAVVRQLVTTVARPNSRAATERGDITWPRDAPAGLPTSLPPDREYPIL